MVLSAREDRALAKSGKSVLHLDRNEFYGEDSASFSFTQLLDWVKDRAHGGTAIGGAAQNRDNQNETSCSATSGTRTAAVGGRNSTASSVCDPETVGLAIARGHARNDLKKEREAEEKERKAADKADGSGDEEEGDGASVKPTGQETGNSDARDESSKETPNSGEGKHPREVDQEKPGGEEQGDPSTTNPTSTEQLEGATATQQKEQQERDRKMKEDEEKKADDELVGKNAALRAKSLDLHFVPLSYHGCRTKAGTPSNTCAQERIQQEAAEEAAAAAGRFGRQPRPSHPAWLSRNNVNKENATGTGGGSAFGEGQEAFLHPSFWGYRTDRALCAADLVRMSRSFNLDLTSQVNVLCLKGVRWICLLGSVVVFITTCWRTALVFAYSRELQSVGVVCRSTIFAFINSSSLPCIRMLTRSARVSPLSPLDSVRLVLS